MNEYVNNVSFLSLSSTHHTQTVADAKESGEKFSFKQLGLRIQIKFIENFANKEIMKLFIDDNLATLLDTLHLILKKELGDVKKADKIIKNLIKIVVKTGVLYRNNQFNPEELALGVKIRAKFRHMALTVNSFSQVESSYDCAFLVTLWPDIGDMLHKLVHRHLTAKSHQRIDSVILALGKEETLDKLFLSKGKYYSHLEGIANVFDKVVDAVW